jgi:hypothetical protein
MTFANDVNRLTAYVDVKRTTSTVAVVRQTVDVIVVAFSPRIRATLISQ